MSLNWQDWIAPRHSSEATLRQLVESFEFRPTDTVVSTYHKSGTTLIQEIVSCLVFGPELTQATVQKKRCPFIDYSPTPRMLLDPQAIAKSLPDPRVLKCHLPPAHLARHLGDSSAAGPKYVVVIRNLKDVLVSAFHHFNGSLSGRQPQIPDRFSEYWRPAVYQPEQFLHHDYFDFNLAWWAFRDHPRVTVLFYEDLVRRKPEQIQRLAEFLGVEMREELLADTLRTTSFQVMQANPNVNYTLHEDSRQYWKPGSNFIRKGEIGDWKNYFTVAESEELDQLIDQRLRGSGLQLTFE